MYGKRYATHKSEYFLFATEAPAQKTQPHYSIQFVHQKPFHHPFLPTAEQLKLATQSTMRKLASLKLCAATKPHLHSSTVQKPENTEIYLFILQSMLRIVVHWQVIRLRPVNYFILIPVVPQLLDNLLLEILRFTQFRLIAGWDNGNGHAWNLNMSKLSI